MERGYDTSVDKKNTKPEEPVARHRFRGDLLDLTPFALHEIQLAERTIPLKGPLMLIPYLDEETSKLLVARDDSIGLHVFGFTREELIREAELCLRLLWNSYVEDESEPLSGDAEQLRANLVSLAIRS
jgi:hypothetical protein